MGPISWRLPSDLKRFKRLTLNHYLIVGRKTYEVLPTLRDRHLVVVSSVPSNILGLRHWIAKSPPDAVALAMTESQVHGCGDVYVGGGAQIYRELWPYATRALITRIDADIEGDIIFPEPENDDSWSWHTLPIAKNKDDEHTTSLDIGVRIV